MCDLTILLILIIIIINQKETTRGHRSEFGSSDGVSCTCGLVCTGASEEKKKKRKNRTTRSYEKPLKEFVVTDHSPRVRVRTLRKFCDESLEKMCFPDNLAYFLHEVTRTTAKKKKRSDSSIREILLQLHRQCMDINLEEYISRTRFFCGRWHATSDDRTYVIGNHVCVVTADHDDDFHHSSSEGEMHDVVPSSSSEDEGEIPVGIVSSSEEDEGEMHVGIVPSSASDDDDYVDRENFKSDEFNAPEPPPRNEIQWVYGRSSPDSKIWQKWAHIMMLYEESETTTVKLQFLHDDGEEEEVRGQLIVNRDNGQISIQWDDGDVWNRVESSPSLGMNRVSKLWRVWSCLRQCLFDDDVENENIYRFTFGNNTRSCPLIWCIVPIERRIVGPSLCDEFERRQNGTVRRSAIVAVSRFPYVFFPQTFFSSLKLSLSRTHTHTHKHRNATSKHLKEIVKETYKNITMIPHNIPRALEMTAKSSQVQHARLELVQWIIEQRFSLPPKPHESIEILCKKLSPSNIVMCLQWLLCEERVLMVSSDVKTLNACSEALLCLLFPLQWKSLYIPVLPRSMLMLTECATPFLFGILEEHLEIITRNQTPRLGIAPTPINLVFLDFDSTWCSSRQVSLNLCPQKSLKRTLEYRYHP